MQSFLEGKMFLVMCANFSGEQLLLKKHNFFMDHITPNRGTHY